TDAVTRRGRGERTRSLLGGDENPVPVVRQIFGLELIDSLAEEFVEGRHFVFARQRLVAEQTQRRGPVAAAIGGQQRGVAFVEISRLERLGRQREDVDRLGLALDRDEVQLDQIVAPQL